MDEAAQAGGVDVLPDSSNGNVGAVPSFRKASRARVHDSPVQGEHRDVCMARPTKNTPSPSGKALPHLDDFIGFAQHVIPIELRGGCAGVIRQNAHA